jgi:hypothetical protein
MVGSVTTRIRTIAVRVYAAVTDGRSPWCSEVSPNKTRCDGTLTQAPQSPIELLRLAGTAGQRRAEGADGKTDPFPQQPAR